jgi:hypothetical protein
MAVSIFVGQTGRDFFTRFKEYVHSFRNNTTNSKFAQNLENGHPMGPMEDM